VHGPKSRLRHGPSGRGRGQSPDPAGGDAADRDHAKGLGATRPHRSE